MFAKVEALHGGNLPLNPTQCALWNTGFGRNVIGNVYASDTVYSVFGNDLIFPRFVEPGDIVVQSIFLISIETTSRL
jgi:hypothetical protein